ncbi:MAG: GNAT family N-acetyltransferase [Actinobacteria bacterium]|uniref:Unannotated protein n=1 Tax=freshwater metagenome TaxID=449393 RepID=A0A6J6NV73_9ZZZZ|nr:GNAT family N-acetyltransferase [Actinomycetota bacterium]
MGGGPAVSLALFGAEHLGGLAALAEDPLVLRFTRFPDPLPEGFAVSWLARYDAGRRTGSMEGFAILADGDFAGIAVAPEIDRSRGVVELGYAVTPELRGRGVATAALNHLTSWALEQQQLQRAELLIGAANVASKRVAEKCGYRYDHTVPNVQVKPGRIEDAEHWIREQIVNSS